MENHECSLAELKNSYFEIQKKYFLPSFEELNEDFQIERLVELETEFLIREIRKFISDKFSNYLRFIESILNPVSVPMFVFSVIKTLGDNERKKLSEVYKKLAKKEVDVIELDISFNEDKEVKFVKESFLIWQEMKKELLGVMKIVNENWDKEIEVNGRGKNYFG